MSTEYTDREILDRVARSITISAGEQSSARRFLQDSSVASKCNNELRVIQEFRRKHGYSYREVEPIFWSEDFVSLYQPLSIVRKAALLEDLSVKSMQEYAELGRSNRPSGKIHDGIVQYLTSIAFDILDVDRPSVPDPTSRGDILAGWTCMVIAGVMTALFLYLDLGWWTLLSGVFVLVGVIGILASRG